MFNKFLEKAGISVMDVMEVAGPLLESGKSDKQAAKEVAHIFDDLIDFRKAVKGPAGAIIEAIDRPLFEAGVLAILKLKRKKE